MKHDKMISAYLLVVLIAFSRLLPHPPGFTPIGALGLFSGAYMGRRWYWVAPLLALLIGDAVIGFYNGLIMLSVYVGFAVSACIGRAILSRRRTPKRLASAILIAALIFFVLTNTSSWWIFYPHTPAGLVACYINGIPFLGVALLGDVVYSAILFGVYELLRRQPVGDLKRSSVP